MCDNVETNRLSWDFHLSSNDANNKDVGSTAAGPSDDIDGQPRPPASTGLIDIGADEFVTDAVSPKAPTNLRVR
jgi:hypothetical protein